MSDLTVCEQAADTLRAWALDEQLKARVLASESGARAARQVARRYVAGETISSAIAAVAAGAERGHLGGIDFAGESVRDTDVADRATRVFLDLAAALHDAPTPTPWISLDLSHVGSVIDAELGLRNARKIAEATAAIGTSMMISAEGSDRTDLVLDLHQALTRDFSHVGITIQAKLRRSAADLQRLLDRPGTIRLVKGAFLESDEIALRRDTTELADAYLDLADTILTAHHPLSIATHDEALVRTLIDRHGDRLASPLVEFEMLLGLGNRLLDELHQQGYRTREYVIFGPDWWLYVLNRIAENPAERVLTALADIQGA